MAQVFVLALLLLATHRAWISDDAYITFRCIENLVLGYGLQWNVGERVEVFTHPLWMMLCFLARLISGEFFYSVTLLSLALTGLLAHFIIRRENSSPLRMAATITPLLLSGSFLSFSTSGLENPLSHLLLAAFAYVWLDQQVARRGLRLAILGGMLALTRMDLALLVFPALLISAARREITLRHFALGLAPFFCWKIFALIYFGFLFPNTYYAKLPVDISLSWRVSQGLVYVLDLVRHDSLTALFIILPFAFASHYRSRREGALLAGIFLYCAYCVFIGGDFMTGRFFTAPFVLGVILSSARFSSAPLPAGFALALAALLALQSPSSPLRTFANGVPLDRCRTAVDPERGETGIVDERACYDFPSTLLSTTRFWNNPRHYHRSEGEALAREQRRQIFEHGAIGMRAFFAGPLVYVIDTYGIASAFLGRLPTAGGNSYRPGHFYRLKPEGFRESIEFGDNRIKNANLKAYYDALQLVMSGPIFTKKRWKAIFDFQLGRFDYLLGTAANQQRQKVTATQLSSARKEGDAWDLPGNVIFSREGVEIIFDGTQHAPWIELSLDWNDSYEIEILAHGLVLARSQVAPGSQGGLRLIKFSIPEAAAATGYDSVRVSLALFNSDPIGSIGHIRLP